MSLPTDLPEMGERGAWLDDKCYGHSYLRVLTTPSNPKVKAAMSSERTSADWAFPGRQLQPCWK